MTRSYAENVKKAVRKVRHADLDRWSEDSLYKSKCPACVDGILLIRRNEKTLRLEEMDFCVACGQAFIYEDIETLRRGIGSHKV